MSTPVAKRSLIQQRVYKETLFLIAASFFFFVWALVNTLVRNDLDIGVACFAVTFIAGMIGWRFSLHPSLVLGRIYKIALFIGVAFTVIIYIIVSFRDVPARTLAYYIINAVLWTAFGVLSFYDADNLIDEASSDINRPLNSLSNDQM